MPLSWLLWQAYGIYMSCGNGGAKSKGKEMKREAGYYRVKHNSNWKIAQYGYLNGGSWLFTTEDKFFIDSNFDSIDENRIEVDPVKELERIEMIADRFFYCGYKIDEDEAINYMDEWHKYKKENGYEN